MKIFKSAIIVLSLSSIGVVSAQANENQILEQQKQVAGYFTNIKQATFK